MNIAVYSRKIHSQDVACVEQLLANLSSKGINVLIFEKLYHSLRKQITFNYELDTFSSYEDVKGKVDYMFSLGGDGTLLDTLAFVRNSNIPIMGINLGRLGFLANIQKQEIDLAVEAVFKGSYVRDKRSLIELDTNIPAFGEANFALNEFGIHKKDTFAMIKIHTYINGEFLNSYWADGLLVSTPTGSTGYSLSCGGPIIIPSSKNFVITPVAPHNLNVRPIVVSDDSVISFEVEGRSENFLCTLDSRFETIDNTHQLAVRKSTFTVTLVRLSDHNFLNTLRDKLHWGADARN